MQTDKPYYVETYSAGSEPHELKSLALRFGISSQRYGELARDAAVQGQNEKANEHEQTALGMARHQEQCKALLKDKSA